MKYQIISAVSAADLESRVNTYIENGWRPIGGVAYVPPNHRSSLPSFLQAVVLETKD